MQNNLAYQNGKMCVIDQMLYIWEDNDKWGSLLLKNCFDEEGPTSMEVLVIDDKISGMVEEFLDELKKTETPNQRYLDRFLLPGARLPRGSATGEVVAPMDLQFGARI